MNNEKITQGAIYDARKLGTSKMVILGIQHMFAMFGATVLVPTLTGLDVATTLLFAGLGTLLFHFITKRKVPAFLGSSFAYLAGYAAIAPNGEPELLPYACFAVAVSGFMYVILAAVVKSVGARKVMNFFPPIVTGPIIISIGLILSSSAINNCSDNWLVAIVAIVVVIFCNMWGKGMIKIVPILIAVVVSYLTSMAVDSASRAAVAEAVGAAEFIGFPVKAERTVFHLLAGDFDAGMLVTACFTIVPLSVATMMEHIGDVCAISSTCEQDYLMEPGLHRTLMGDGMATALASLFGAPANTTYGENTGVLALSKVYDPKVVELAALFAMALSFSPKFAALISAMPAGTIGGVSLVLYGMISAVGVRNVVENQVDFTNTRNVIIAALILVLSLGISTSAAGGVVIGSINLSGLAVASIVGILLNAILPGKDYDFEAEDGKSVNFQV